MTRLLCVLMFMMTTQVWAQSSGIFLDDDDQPTAQPAAPQQRQTPPAVRPNQATTPNAPATRPSAPSARPATGPGQRASNFVRCPNFSEKATDAVAMIQEVLNIPQPIGKTMAAEDGNSFKLLRTRRDELQVEAVVVGGSNEGRHHLAGSICQMRDGGLQVKLVHDSGFYTGFITVRPLSSDQVRITQVEGGRENPRKSGVYSVQ